MILHKNQKGFPLSPVYKHLKGIICIYKEQKGHPTEENQHYVISFFSNLFKKWMKKFVELITKEKWKIAMNEWDTRMRYLFKVCPANNNLVQKQSPWVVQ